MLEAISEAMGLDDIVNPLLLESFAGMQSEIGTYNFLSDLRLMWAST